MESYKKVCPRCHSEYVGVGYTSLHNSEIDICGSCHNEEMIMISKVNDKNLSVADRKKIIDENKEWMGNIQTYLG